MFLEIPESRHPIEYLIDMVPSWKTFSSITVSRSAYERILSYKDEETMRESGKYYCGPKIIFELKQITCDLYEVLWIEHKGMRYYFNNNTIDSVYITCKSAA